MTGRFVDMVDPNADAYVVRGINPGAPGDVWRWTGPRPELRFFLESVANVDFVADFAIADDTFKDTGPVVVSILINGNLLDKVKCDKPGERHFSKAVPPALLYPNAPNFAALEPDKVWVAPTDKVKLGLLLIRAGFKP